MRRTLILAALTLLLAGCATLDEQECRTKTPAQLGLKDGQQGYGLWRLDRDVSSCARFDIPFDRSAYLQAYHQGLLQYCTPANGAKVGARGESYEYVCPADSEPAFLAQYRPAYNEYMADMHDGHIGPSHWFWH
jgi:hypothetical protein